MLCGSARTRQQHQASHYIRLPQVAKNQKSTAPLSTVNKGLHGRSRLTSRLSKVPREALLHSCFRRRRRRGAVRPGTIVSDVSSSRTSSLAAAPQQRSHPISSFDDDALSFHPPSSSRTPFAPFHLAAAAVLHLVDAVSGYAVVKAALTLTLAAEATWAWISPGTPPQPRPTL